LFFLASKTIGALLIPSNFIIFVGLMGLLLAASRYRTAGRWLLALSVTLFLLCGFSPLANLLMIPLEMRFPVWNPEGAEPDGVVVLGGPIDAYLSAAHGTPVFSDSSADCIFAAAALARRYPKMRIVYAGGSPGLFQSHGASEADYAVLAFQNLGVAHERLLAEGQSRNTQENAEFSKAVAVPKSTERWLLITSAYHMPRSIGLFRKVGFRVEAYPVDWQTRGSSDRFALPSRFLVGLILMDIASHEWIGLVADRIFGLSNDFFPSPEN
jgi:uncharacterized SAM-binding protein YcdF (DUF218 family)